MALSLDLVDYNELIESVLRVKTLSKETRRDIIDKAFEEVPLDVYLAARKKIFGLHYNEEFYKAVGLAYCENTGNVFTAGYMDYLLSHSEFYSAEN